MISEPVISICDLGMRRWVAECAMGEPAVAYLLEHEAACPGNWGHACTCGLIAWFWGASKAVGIDGTLAEDMRRVQ